VSLLSFNVGVEIGQVAIVGTVWVLLLLVERGSRRLARYGRNATAFGAIVIAAIWTGERALSLAQLLLVSV
jgi:hypothetical protein